jgi:hypothetical protein
MQIKKKPALWLLNTEKFKDEFIRLQQRDDPVSQGKNEGQLSKEYCKEPANV